MKISTKQKNDIEISLYFAPLQPFFEVTPEDMEKYLLFSENGKKFSLLYPNESVNTLTPIVDGFTRLVQGKRWKDIEIKIYEESICAYDGMGYIDILLDENYQLIPYNVMQFLAKRMFGGMDYEIITDLYESIMRGIPVEEVRFGTDL